VTAEVRIEQLSTVDSPARDARAGDTGAVLALVAAATAADGAAPVGEHVLLHLRAGGPPESRDLVAYDGDTLAGYGHLDLGDDGPSAELTVHPGHRRRGIGAALLRALEAEAGGSLAVWAHGRLPGAVALAAGRGYTEQRILWQLRRPLADLPDVPLPAGITLRPFRVGADEAAWLAVNNAAFADHPDQGGWGPDDIAVREAEPWFDPAGFLLAEDEAGALVGFHWTKVHAADRPDGTDTVDSAPIGEVYVLGVDPGSGGHGLGAALTVAGLRHLAGRGLDQVMLYVDDSNPRAVRLYERLGFDRWKVDIRYGRDGTG
jgi:mycothiol synthase